MSCRSWESGKQRGTSFVFRASRTAAGFQTTVSRCAIPPHSRLPQLTLAAVRHPPTLLPAASRNRRPLLPSRSAARSRPRQSRQGARAGARSSTGERQSSRTHRLSPQLLSSLLLPRLITGKDQVHPPPTAANRGTASNWFRSTQDVALDLSRPSGSVLQLHPRSHAGQLPSRVPPAPIRDGPGPTPQRRLRVVCPLDVVAARRGS